MGVEDGEFKGKEVVWPDPSHPMDPSVTSPWNLVILSEGYKADEPDELTLFSNQVQEFVHRFLTFPPFDLFKDVIQITRLDVSSTESGIDDPLVCLPDLPGSGVKVKTFFDATLCGGGTIRFVINLDESLVDDTIGRQMAPLKPWEIDAKLVFINSDKIGGSAGAGIGKLCIAQPTGVDPIKDAALFDDAVHTQIHELGHSGFGLADEYDYDYSCPGDPSFLVHDGIAQEAFPGFPPGSGIKDFDEPNVTIETTPSALKWSDLILTPDISPVPPIMKNPDSKTCSRGPSPPSTLSPSMEGAGLFEGANHFRTKIFRPQFSCKMFTVATQFCVVCKRTIMQKMWIHIYNTKKLTWALIQHILIRLGLLSPPINGEPTGDTIVALQNFQMSKTILPSGKVDPFTWEALSQSLRDIIDVSTKDKFLKHGKTDDDNVALLQRVLWLLISPNGTPPVSTSIIGFPPGHRDCTFGPLTFSSVMLFQRQKGLTEDGKVGPKTLNGLIESLSATYPLLTHNFLP